MTLADLARSVLRSGMLQGLALASGLAATVLLARALGPAGFGQYAFVLSCILLAALPLNCGMPPLLVRELSRARVDGCRDRVRSLIRFSSTVACCNFLLVLAALLVGGLWAGLPPGLDPVTLTLAVLSVPLVAAVSLQRAMVNGMGRTLLSQVPELLLRPAAFLVLLAIALATTGLDVATSLLCLLLSYLLSALVGALTVARLAGRGPPAGGWRSGWSDWLRALPALALFVGSQVLISQIDILMVALMSSERDTGLYKLAATAASQLMLLASVVNQYLAPRLGVSLAAGDRAAAGRLVRRGVILCAGTAALLLLLLAIFGKTLILLLVGRPYLPAADALLILAAAYLVYAASAPVSAYLTAAGKESLLALASLAAVLGNVALNALLIPRFGFIGAAFATAAAITGWRLALTVVFLRRALRDRPAALPITCSGP